MLEKSITKHDEIITVLKDLYTSFNKVQIKAYLPLEQTILKVIAKAENHDDAFRRRICGVRTYGQRRDVLHARPVGHTPGLLLQE